MYKLKPHRVYAVEHVMEDEACRARIKRLLSGIGKTEQDLIMVNEHNIYDIARELQGWSLDKATGDCPAQWQRPLIFTRINIDDTEREKPLLENCPDGVSSHIVATILGHFELFHVYHDPESDAERNMVCWTTRDFGVMKGCPHGCQYCGSGKDGKYIAVGVNIEEYMEKVVTRVVEDYPGQRCFRMIGWTADIITFEPEYDVFQPFLDTLARYEGRYGYFHTASDNVDWMADLRHRDRLIGIWSVTCEKVAREIEPGSPSAISRVEAGRKCQEMGIPIRFKFKPMIPVRGWREEYASIIEEMFKRTKPESVGFCVIMWMDLETLAKKIDLDLLDPEYVKAAEDAAEEMKDVRTGPFPHHIRAEIYRFLIREVRKWDKKVPVFISTESREMWDELKDEIGQNPRTFICGCNPIQVPGPRMKFSEEVRGSTYLAVEEMQKVQSQEPRCDK